METNLLPCPFCGSKDLIKFKNFVACKTCSTLGPNEKPEDGKIQVLWNTRVNIPTIQENLAK